MKLTFWQRLLRALELYCSLRQQEIVAMGGSESAVSRGLFAEGEEGVLNDYEQLELEFPDIVKNSLNADQFAKKYELVGGVSMTIPAQTLSIREIMKRFASGLPIDGEKVPVYNGEDDDMPDLSKMDLAERQEYLESAEKELVELKLKIDKDRLKKAEKPEKQPHKGVVDPELGKEPVEGDPPVGGLQFPESKKDKKV